MPHYPINEAGYIGKILERFGMADTSPASTPMDPGASLHAILATETPADVKLYQQAIGTLLYAALGTHPDITYAMSILGQ